MHHYAAAACARQVDAVQAEFGKAGLSVEAINKALKQYKPYVNRGMESQLSPRIQVWPQKLGSEQLPVRLQQQPSCRTCNIPDQDQPDKSMDQATVSGSLCLSVFFLAVAHVQAAADIPTVTKAGSASSV